MLDGPDSWVQALAADKTIEQFIPIDFSDAESVFERCCQAITRARKVRFTDVPLLYARLILQLGACSPL